MRPTAVALAVLMSLRAAASAHGAELEASFYGGVRPRSATGGPTTDSHRVTYLGYGVEASNVTRDGLVVRAGFSIERHGYCTWAGDCPWPGGSGPFLDDWVEGSTSFPRVDEEYGAHARIGWRFDWFAFEVGFATFSESIGFGYERAGRTWKTVPDVALRFGNDRGWLALGVGTYDAPTIQAAGGLYIRGRLPIDDRWGLLLAAGVAGDAFGYFFRADAALEWTIDARWKVGAGGAMLEAKANEWPRDNRIEPEARVFGGMAF